MKLDESRFIEKIKFLASNIIETKDADLAVSNALSIISLCDVVNADTNKFQHTVLPQSTFAQDISEVSFESAKVEQGR